MREHSLPRIITCDSHISLCEGHGGETGLGARPSPVYAQRECPCGSTPSLAAAFAPKPLNTSLAKKNLPSPGTIIT